MKFLSYCLVAASFLVTDFIIPQVTAQGLYGDDTEDLTTGNLNDQDYWWAKFDATMLELAIKTRQPEGRISVDLASSIRRLDDLVTKYPKHQGIAKWRARAQQVDAKIDPNATRSASFTGECPWDEANFAHLWVNLNWAKFAYSVKDYNTTYGDLQNVLQNYQYMLRPDRMKNYPDDLRTWVIDSKPDADTMYKSVKEKLHR